jgi:hypothetical protein
MKRTPLIALVMSTVTCALPIAAQAVPPRPTFATPQDLPVWPEAEHARVLEAHRLEPRPVFRETVKPASWLAADFSNVGDAPWRMHHQDATVELIPLASQMKSKVIATLRAHETGVVALAFWLIDGEEVTWSDADGNPLVVALGDKSQGYQLATVALPEALTPEVDFQVIAERTVPLDCTAGGFLGFKSCEFGASVAWATEGVVLRQAMVVHDPTSVDLHVITPASLVGAAAGIPQGSDELADGRLVWHFHQPEPTENCAFYMGDFQSLDAPASEDMPAMRVSMAKYFANAPNILQLMHDVIGYYGSYFTVFPWKQLNMTQLENDFGGGQSFLSGIHANRDLFGSKPTDNGWLDSAELLAHEMGHQWWGNDVAPAGNGDVALSESLAEFSACLFVETHLDTRHLELMDNISYTFRVDAKSDVALGSSAVFSSSSYVDIVYHKGAVVLHMLRRQLGDAVMSKVLHDYTAKFGRDYASIEDLRAVVETSSGVPMKWFFTQWFKQKGVMRAEVASELLPQADGSWQVRVRFHQPDAKPKQFRLNATLFYAGGDSLALSADVTPNASGDAVVQWSSAKRPARVRLDPDRLLLRQFLTGTPADVTLDGLTDGADFVDMALRVGRGLHITGKNGQTYFIPDINFNELYDMTADLVINADDLDALETWMGTETEAF